MFFFLPCLEPGAARTFDMRLLGRGLGQRCMVLGPAEHEAENITQTWWAGGDIHLRVHHWESGNACQAQPAFSADFGGAASQLGQGCIWWALATWRREGTLPQHSWERWQGTAGVECHMCFMPVWALCASSIKQGCGVSRWIGQKTFRA